MCDTVIPPNLFRKNARAQIQSVWSAGNGPRPVAPTKAEQALAATAERRTKLTSKINDVAALRANRRSARG